MRKLIGFLLLAAPAWASGFVCLGPTGSSSLTLSTSAGSWTQCEGGGTGIPADGDWVIWRSTGTLTINQNLGTVGGGGVNDIRQENGTITVSAGVTIVFNSTGTNPVGSGTAANPGADSTSKGILLSNGTAFNVSGTAASRAVLTAANGTSPIWMAHSGDSTWTGCTTFTANVCNGSSASHNQYPVTFAYADFYVLGTNTSGFYGLYWANFGTNVAVSFDHCQFFNPFQVIYDTANTGSISFTNNYISNPSGAYPLETTRSNTGPSATVTGNTLITGAASAAAGALYYCLQGCGSTDYEQNAVSSTATASYSGLISTTNFSNNNTIKNAYDQFAEPSSQGQYCTSFWVSTGDTTSSYTKNVCGGGSAVQLHIIATGSLAVNPTLSWISQWKHNAPSQGQFITYGGATTGTQTFSLLNNVLVVEDADSSNFPISFLGFTGGAFVNFIVVNLDHNTAIQAASNGGQGLQMGEDTTAGAVASSRVRSNLVLNGAANGGSQIMDGNSSGLNTFNTSACSNSVGVCNNLTYGAGTNGAYHRSSASGVNGFDNNVQLHPNALYGDLAVNPMLAATGRRPCGFGVVLGLDGTCGTLFAALASRALGAGTGGCANGVCGTFTDGGYGASSANVFEAMRLWLFKGATPQNPQVWCAGSDGEAMGAVPFCKQGKVFLAAAFQ